MIVETFLKVMLIIVIISIKENKVLSENEYLIETCFDINSTTQLTLETPSFTQFYTTRFVGLISTATNVTKYKLNTNMTTRSLTFISIDKYDTGNGTYYTAFDDADNGGVIIYNIYNTLIFSKF